MRFIARIVVVLSILLFASPVFAASESSRGQIPEKDGIFDDPDHPGLKVRVFVHKERPQTDASAVLVCNLADSDSAAVVGPTGWHLPANWTYNLNPGTAPSSVGAANLPAIAANSFNTWQSAIFGKVAFSPGANTTVSKSAYDGKNVIAWGRINRSALAITYTRYYTSTGNVVDQDTIFNKGFAWSWSNSNTCADTNSYDVQNILTHEVGHWMGLNDHYDATYANNTMFGYGSKGEVKKNTLTSGDISGVSAIYP